VSARLRAATAIALLFSGVAPSSGAEPPPRFRHVTARDGLASNWVRSILRDRRGFLWVGTQNGLSRYDGVSFRSYEYVPGQAGGLPFPVAGVLHEDHQGRLWVGSSWSASGMARYDWETDTFVPFPPEPGGLGSARVEVIVEDGEGRLWIGGEAGVDAFDPDSGRFRSYPFQARRGGLVVPVNDLALAPDGTLWIGTYQGIYRLDPRRSETCVPWDPAEPGLSGLGRTPVSLLRQGEVLWAATLGDGLYRIDTSTGATTRFVAQPGDPTRLPTNRLRCLAAASDGRLWIGTENGGLSVFDPATGRSWTHRPDLDDPESLNSASIWALHVDRQGIVWIGTYSGGLNELSPLAQRFELIGRGPNRLSDPHVEAVLEDHEGNLWVGTDGGGLDRRDGRTNRFRSFRHDRSDPATLGSDSVFAIAEDGRGVIWLGGWESGLCRLDPDLGRVVRYRNDPGDPQTIVSDSVWAIVVLQSGELLVGTQGGADLFDRRTGRFTRLSRRYPGALTGFVFSAIETPAGEIWVGGADQAQRLDPRSGVIETFRYAVDDPTSLGRGVVAAIRADSEGNVWLGTEGGLGCLPHGASSLRRYTTADGLPHDTVTNILEDGSGNLWVTTHRGLSKLVGAVHLPDPIPILSFDEKDGLQGPEFGRDASTRGRDGRLYFGGPGGLNVFDPERIQRNLEPPPVRLTEVRVFDRPVVPGVPGSPLQRAITEATELTLSPSDSSVTFEFTALNLLLPEKSGFAFRLEGFDDRWSYVGTQRTATYTNLPHGRFTFRVRAANSDGIWNQDGAHLDVIVLPRWYERTSTRLLLLLALSALVYAGHRYRVRRLTLRERELSLRVEERTVDLNRLNAELEQRVSARTAELESEKERLSVTLRSIGDGVIAADVDGGVVLMNRVAERLTGWTLAEAVGRRLSEVFAVVDRETGAPLSDLVQRVVSGGEILELPARSRLQRRDGQPVEIADSVAPIRDPESRTVGVVVVFRDVGERLRMEEQIQNVQKLEALGILAGGLAHDFNNLLTGIFGHVDLALRRRPADPGVEGSLGKALSVLEMARGLTSQLLTFSQAGQPAKQPLSLGAALERGCQFALSGSNVTCRLEVPSGLWLCEGDPRQIDQVIDNLLLNARQAMPGGGEITLAAHNLEVPPQAKGSLAPGRYVRLRVCDQGPGISAEVRTRVFEPFFTTKASGSGLGLATSYSILRKHGGHIEVETSPPGRGAALSIYLPAAAPDRLPPPADEAEARQGQGRILVLDDELYVREVAQEMLEGLGYTVEAVATAEACVLAVTAALAASTPFDLAILDLTIPGGSGGVEALSRLRALQPDLRAVASSGYSVDAVMRDPLAHGFQGGLTKPYTMAELSEVLRKVLPKERS
jgi:PAS domain S-box-containing protein